MPRNPNRSPFHRLPVETVASIFLYTLPEPDDLCLVDPRRDQVLLRSVCRHWRAVTENTAAFWSTVFIRLPRVSEGSIAMQMLKNTERWSANKALSVYIAQHPRKYQSYEEPSQEFISAILRLRPRITLLHVTTDYCDTGIHELFPLRHTSQLRCLTLGLNTCAGLEGSALFDRTEDMSALDVFSYELDDDDPSEYSTFLPFPSTRKLFVKGTQIYVNHIEAICAIPTLEYLHLTGPSSISPGGLSSSSLFSLDIEFSHTDYFTEIDMLGSLPNLTHLVIRLAGDSRTLLTRHIPLLHDLPELPALRTVTIGMGPDIANSHSSYCDCLVPLMSRTRNLVALEVHLGHALSALKHLSGSRKIGGSKDISCPDLKLLRVVVTNPKSKSHPAIAQSCVDLLEDRPSLEIQWHCHEISKVRGAEREGNATDADGEKFKIWQELPDGVKKGVHCLRDGPDASLARLYGVEQF